MADRPPNFVRGHWPKDARLNVRQELRRLRNDPLERVFAAWGVPLNLVRSDADVGRYRGAFLNYYLTLTRLLPEMSLIYRYDNTAGWAKKEGRRYTPSERKLAAKFNAVARYGA